MAGVFTIEKIGLPIVGKVVDGEIEDMEFPSFLLHFTVPMEGGEFSTVYDLGYVQKGLSDADLFPTVDGKKVIHTECDDDKGVEYQIKVTRKDGTTTYTFKCDSNGCGTFYTVSVPVCSPDSPFITELKKLQF